MVEDLLEVTASCLVSDLPNCLRVRALVERILLPCGVLSVKRYRIHHAVRFFALGIIAIICHFSLRHSIFGASLSVALAHH